MKSVITSFLLAAGLVALNGCKKEDPAAKQPDSVTFSNELKGSNIAPTPVTTTSGSGTATGTFDKNSNELAYTITFSNLSGPVTLAHLHTGAPGIKGPSFYTTASNISPITGKVTLTQTQREALLTGNMYVNLHTQQHQDLGEVRANLVIK